MNVLKQQINLDVNASSHSHSERTYWQAFNHSTQTKYLTNHTKYDLNHAINIH